MVEDDKKIEGWKYMIVEVSLKHLKYGKSDGWSWHKTLKCWESDGWRSLKRWRTKNLMVEVS